MTPPRAARPPPAAQTKRMTRSTSMPDEAARSRLSATARMALPILVLFNKRPTPISTTIDSAIGDEVLRRDGDRAEVDALLHGVVGVGPGATAEDVQEEVAEQDGHADGDDEHGDEAGAPLAEAPPEGEVVERSGCRPDEDGQKRGGMSWMPRFTLSHQAAIAPKVTISPWEKLVRPVVPKISERPMAPMAMTRPNLIPSTSSWANFSRPVTSCLSLSPRGKSSGRLWPGRRVNSRVARSGLRRSTPLGSESTSRVAL